MEEKKLKNETESENPKVDNKDTQAEAVEAAPPDPFKLAREGYEWVEMLVGLIVSVLLIFTFIGRIAYVDGPSMNETLHDGDMLIVSNLLYTPKQNDIVVFQAYDSSIRGGIVKRVIATEGQVVDIDFETWTVTVDGAAIDEPYVNYEEGYPMRYGEVEFPLTVPEGKVFVMGDNRNHSNDSRGKEIGCVDTRFIFGRLIFKVPSIKGLFQN